MNQADKHFHMSEAYAENSSSQRTIGQITIGKAVESLAAMAAAGGKNCFYVLDLACGPGNLTCDLRDAIAAELPGRQIVVTGLDYSRMNVDKLIENSRGEIRGLVGSFFEASSLPDGVDLIFSNEGLHWQPPHEMDEIIYSHLDPGRKEQYIQWAMQNFKTALQNIFDSLADNGVAVLQFGNEGQLSALWRLIRDVLNQTGFSGYKPSISFPLFYPTLDQMGEAVKDAGFRDADIGIEAFNQDLTENTPEVITAFLRAFSEPALRREMDEDVVAAFYSAVSQKLANTDLDAFRKDAWHRTLVTLKK